MIRFRDVSKRFPGSSTDAVDHLSLDLPRGHLIALIGPSGCGKTTILKMINRLVEPTAGTIEVGGRDVTEQDVVQLRRSIGYVIQNVGLMPHRTVEQNILTVPDLLGWDAVRKRQRTAELIEMFDLEPDFLSRYPAELSGGQRQRVGVARALAADPPVMLMDEPFGAVDPIVRERLQDQFLRIQEKIRKTIVLVTHDLDEAIKMADRIALMNVGGVVEQYATPAEILRAPANSFVASFIGEERGLKRLSLMKVSDVHLEEGPVAEVGAPVDAARRAADRFGSDWVVLTRDGRLLGWAAVGDLDGRGDLGTVEARPFSVRVTPRDSLRQALDAIVTSATNVAAVTREDGTYEGILTLEHLSKDVGR